MIGRTEQVCCRPNLALSNRKEKKWTAPGYLSLCPHRQSESFWNRLVSLFRWRVLGFSWPAMTYINHTLGRLEFRYQLSGAIFKRRCGPNPQILNAWTDIYLQLSPPKPRLCNRILHNPPDNPNDVERREGSALPSCQVETQFATPCDKRRISNRPCPGSTSKDGRTEVPGAGCVCSSPVFPESIPRKERGRESKLCLIPHDKHYTTNHRSV